MHLSRFGMGDFNTPGRPPFFRLEPFLGGSRSPWDTYIIHLKKPSAQIDEIKYQLFS